jgi:hypothetical protein
MVTREPATYSSKSSRDMVEIQGDHSTIVKFTGIADMGYIRVVQKLQECVENSCPRRGGPFCGKKNSHSRNCNEA